MCCPSELLDNDHGQMSEEWPSAGLLDLEFPAKKQKQIKGMIHGIKAGFDIVVSYPCGDMQRSMLSFKIDS